MGEARSDSGGIEKGGCPPLRRRLLKTGLKKGLKAVMTPESGLEAFVLAASGIPTALQMLVLRPRIYPYARPSTVSRLALQVSVSRPSNVSEFAAYFALFPCESRK